MRPTGGSPVSAGARRGLAELETIVTLTPDMSATAMYSDYVLPIASHYERKDFMLESRTPYIQVLDEAVPAARRICRRFRGLSAVLRKQSAGARRSVALLLSRTISSACPCLAI